jgi:ABC-type oligopeptide transport system substrate-binding subunit
MVMELIIDFDKIKDPSKREWLINSLKLMKIGFQTTEKPQTIAQYNSDLEKGDAEITRGEFISATDLKAEAKKW